MNDLWRLPFEKVEALTFPVYRQDLPERSLFYTPGYLVMVNADYVDEFLDQLNSAHPALRTARKLQDYGKSAAQSWEFQFKDMKFEPLCLTLYTSQRCNLNCSYCFSQDAQEPLEADLDIGFILSAAETVIENCKKEGAPFTLVIHGGGEPTLDQRLPQLMAEVEQLVSRSGIGSFRYLATNGVMPEETARWAVQTFDEIGLSCDGMPEIHAVQRPLKNGKNSIPWVEQTAKVIKAAGKALHIRVTITSQTMRQMPEIASYLYGTLQADEVRVEPVFQGRRSGQGTGIADELAEDYFSSFMQARSIAASYNKRWISTGVQLEGIHSRYCQVFRRVLHLVPGDGISACFKMSGRRQAQDKDLDISNAGRTGVDAQRVQMLQSILAQEDAACENCVNHYHCARGCPDRCPHDPASSGEDGLRCRINRLMTTAFLQERAEALKPYLHHYPTAGCTLRGGQS